MTGHNDMLRMLNILKVACAGAILCNAIVGAFCSLFAGGDPSVTAQITAAAAGAVAAGAAKALAILP